MRCGQLWPSTTRYCATRLRPTTGSCRVRLAKVRGGCTVLAQRDLELPVRMGLATGEAELRDSDYFGAVLNRAARVMAAGHGGQILLADSTAVLLSGVDLVDLGPRRLRDVPMPMGIFQVEAEGLRTEFPNQRRLGKGCLATSFVHSALPSKIRRRRISKVCL